LHFYVGIILPCIGLTITTVIGSNIALSLGMIGALSIIRFRTPVRSPYELVHYFSLLTVGIAAKANLYIATILILLLVILPHVLVVLYKTKVGEILSFKSKKNSHDHLITLNFSGLKKYEDIEKLLKDSNIMNISINKNSKNLIKFNGQSVFKDENLKNKFLSEYSNLFNNYDVEREKNINFY
jgi:Ca2+/Na+ antiporter